MSASTATKLEACNACFEVKLIVYDEDFVWLNLMKTAQCAHRLTTEIHKRIGLQKPYIASIQVSLRHLSMKAFFLLERHASLLCQQRHKPKSSVMPIGFVFTAWIAKANN
jgi:hypothetical protein